MFCVNLVHSHKIGEIGHKHRSFDDVGKSQFLVIQNRFNILQRALGLHFDVNGNQIAGD
jgi:hypothetical protein